MSNSFFLDVCLFFYFKGMVCMDSGYYYYFDDCNLINYTNYLRGNKNEKEGYEKLQELKEKWKDKYASAFKI